MSFWLKELGNVILIDIVIAFLIVSAFVVWGRKQLPQGVGGMRYYVEKNEDGGAYEYIIEGSDEKKYRYDVNILWEIIEIPSIILLGMETIVLFIALFRTADVRRRLKPLNDLAVTAEKLSKEPINMSFWLKELGNVILIDIVIAFLIVSAFVVWGRKQLPQGVGGMRYYVEKNEDGGAYEYIIEGSDEKKYRYDVNILWEIIEIPSIILLGMETIVLFIALFRTADVRRRLKPLNDLAVTAEKLSKEPMDHNKIDDLEKAISHLSADDDEQVIHTGDKDLQSIEIALNNLLRNMKENEKRQMRFVSDASHELRTPIAVIQGYVNMLDRWGKEDEQVLEESIEALKNESQHMKELVEQLLFLARGDSGRQHLNMEKTDLNRMVSEVWEESMMIDESHRYEFRGTENEACVLGDVAMIKQSVRIFVQNAAKYSEPGTAIILGVKEEPGYVSYMIEDEGTGMNPGDLAHIFDRFYRSDEARNNETGGSGLGLSIAKWIVDAHGGTIQVISRADIGSRFVVRFPKIV